MGRGGVSGSEQRQEVVAGQGSWRGATCGGRRRLLQSETCPVYSTAGAQQQQQQTYQHPRLRHTTHTCRWLRRRRRRQRACRNQSASQPMHSGTNCCLCNAASNLAVLLGGTLKHRAVAHSHPLPSGRSTWCRRRYRQPRKSCTGHRPSGGRSGTAGRQAGGTK